MDATDKVMFHAQDTGITPGTEVKVMIVAVYKNFAPSYPKTVKCKVMPASKIKTENFNFPIFSIFVYLNLRNGY